MELLGSPAISQYHLVSFCAYPFCLTVSTQPTWVLTTVTIIVWSTDSPTSNLSDSKTSYRGMESSWVQSSDTFTPWSKPLLIWTPLRIVAIDPFLWLLLWYMELPSLGFGMIIPTVSQLFRRQRRGLSGIHPAVRPTRYQLPSRVSNTRTILGNHLITMWKFMGFSHGNHPASLGVRDSGNQTTSTLW